MKYDMDELLKNALSAKEEPDYWLNQSIIKQIEGKENTNMSKTNRRMRIPAIVMLTAAVVVAGSASVYAAWKYLTPQQVAEINKDEGLVAAFQSEDAVAVGEVQECGDYRITLLGIVSGKNLSKYAGMDDTGNILNDRTYVVTAIENADGTPRPDTSEDDYGKDPFFVSPLIEGLNPSIYNSVMMGGAYSEMVEDGVQYRIAECDNVEKFADRQVYLCVNDGTFYNNDAYIYDEQSGAISRNKQYQGVNALFTLPLDKNKADPKAAEDYVKQIEDEWNGNGESEEVEESTASETEKLVPGDTDVTSQAAEESKDWKLADFEKNTELVKEMELTPDADGNYAYRYEISADGPASEGILGKEELSDRDEGNMAKCRGIMSGEDSHTAYIQTFTLKEDGNVVLRVYKYRK